LATLSPHENWSVGVIVNAVALVDLSGACGGSGVD